MDKHANESAAPRPLEQGQTDESLARRFGAEWAAPLTLEQIDRAPRHRVTNIGE